MKSLPPGHDVLVFREEHGWTPYPLVRVINNNVDVILPSGNISTFAIRFVRPFYPHGVEKKTWEEIDSPANVNRPKTAAEFKDDYAVITRALARKLQAQSEAFTLVPRAFDEQLFRESSMLEMSGLKNMGCFETVESSHTDGHRLYRARFADK